MSAWSPVVKVLWVLFFVLLSAVTVFWLVVTADSYINYATDAWADLGRFVSVVFSVISAVFLGLNVLLFRLGRTRPTLRLVHGWALVSLLICVTSVILWSMMGLAPLTPFGY